jgi:hypothetical protein
MGIPSRFKLPFIVQCILFLVPVNIYVVGDWLAAGMQWIFFRYQQSYLGNGFIIFARDLDYIRYGWITGRSAFAAEVAMAASLLLMLALLVFLYIGLKESATHAKAGALITIAGGCLFLLSDMIQYGMFFHGPAGFAIPVGVPVILVCGWWMYQMKFPDTITERSDELKPVDEDKIP